MKIGLALSGGGILGAAHIEVLKELEKNKIKIDHIAGTSAGAIIASIYASRGIKGLEAFYKEATSIAYFSKDFFKQLVPPDKFFGQIKDLIFKYTFTNIEEAKIKLSIIGTNVLTGKEEIFEKGDTASAVMASSAYPGIFPTQKIGANFYLDGGLTLNLPSEVLNDCDFIIGSNLCTVPKSSIKEVEKMNIAQILLRSNYILQNKLTELQAKECNFCFNIPTDSVKWYQFDKINQIKELGKKTAQKQMPKLLKLIMEK